MVSIKKRPSPRWMLFCFCIIFSNLVIMIPRMTLSENGYKFLHQEEGLRLNAYQDSVGVWTIGYGNTYYENGTKVKKGDTITKARAEQLFKIIVKQFENAVNDTITRCINQNQFDALVSLAYNIGTSGFKTSTVVKRVNANPCDKSIADAFEMWKNAGGKPILLARRKREHKLYFS